MSKYLVIGLLQVWVLGIVSLVLRGLHDLLFGTSPLRVDAFDTSLFLEWHSELGWFRDWVEVPSSNSSCPSGYLEAFGLCKHPCRRNG